MAQLTKFLLDKHEKLSSIPKSHFKDKKTKAPWQVACPCNPSTEEAEQGFCGCSKLIGDPSIK